MIPANPLEYAAVFGNLSEVVELARGVDIDEPGVCGYTALHGAAENGHLDVIRLLLEAGASVNPALNSGHTPVDLADLAGKPEAAALLREAGGVNAVPPDTPFNFGGVSLD